MDTDISQLFGPDHLEAFENGVAAHLIKGRNRNLGAMLVYEHSVYYIQILYRMLCYRREHELEPLNDDIYNAVKGVQEKLSGEDYTVERFNQQMNQLVEWNLIKRRIEKERLRGYRDVRRDKFRYSLEDDTVSFLLWLEERLQQDIEGDYHDTRNLLYDVEMRLKETIRELERIDPATANGNDENLSRVRSALYYFSQIDGLTASISQRLIALNARLGAFLVSAYSLDDARKVVEELELYLTSYLRQILISRKDILSAVEELDERRLEVLNYCYEVSKDEERKTGILLRSRRKIEEPALIIKRLISFYDTGGQLDKLCHRINESSMKVWGKMSAHLRELERKNTRLDNLRVRISEIAKMPENAVPKEFIHELLSSGQMISDRNYWDEFEKANPPQPRREADRKRVAPEIFIRQKSSRGVPVQSLEESRLEGLQNWIKQKYKFNRLDAVNVDSVEIESIEDFRRVLEIGRRGILAKGKGLNKIDFELKVKEEMCELTGPDGCTLEFKKMRVVSKAT